MIIYLLFIVVQRHHKHKCISAHLARPKVFFSVFVRRKKTAHNNNNHRSEISTNETKVNDILTHTPMDFTFADWLCCVSCSCTPLIQNHHKWHVRHSLQKVIGVMFLQYILRNSRTDHKMVCFFFLLLCCPLNFLSHAMHSMRFEWKRSMHGKYIFYYTLCNIRNKNGFFSRISIPDAITTIEWVENWKSKAKLRHFSWERSRAQSSIQ